MKIKVKFTLKNRFKTVPVLLLGLIRSKYPQTGISTLDRITSRLQARLIHGQAIEKRGLPSRLYSMSYIVKIFLVSEFTYFVNRIS